MMFHSYADIKQLYLKWLQVSTALKHIALLESVFVANNHNILSPFQFFYLLFFEIAYNAIKSPILI